MSEKSEIEKKTYLTSINEEMKTFFKQNERMNIM